MLIPKLVENYLRVLEVIGHWSRSVMANMQKSLKSQYLSYIYIDFDQINKVNTKCIFALN